MKSNIRQSSYGDYIAVDLIDEQNKILSTPFYIKEGEQVECHWGRPSSEQCEYPRDYEDFHDRYSFRMEGGKLTVAWLNGPCFGKKFSPVVVSELPEWKWKFVRKVIPQGKVQPN